MILEARLSKLLVLAGVAGSCFAGEYAVLSSGFSLRVDRHEANGAHVRLYSNGGFTEMPAAQIAGFEAEEQLAQAPEPRETTKESPAAPDAMVPPAAPDAMVTHEANKVSREPNKENREAKISPQALVTAAAERHGLPPEFVHSVVSAESAYRTNAVSPKGAIGLMQLMPATARAYGADPKDPAQNVEAGTQYLSELLLKYQHDAHQVTRALAAYNAGPGAVERHHGVPPYRETRAYVTRVVRKYQEKKDPPAH